MLITRFETPRKCAVCGKEINEGWVGCGLFVAQTYTYCVDCAKGLKEPYLDVVASFAGHKDHMIHPSYKEIVEDSVAARGKTMEEFWHDVDTFYDGMD